MSVVTVMKCIELDAGHRVPFHSSKCRHLHGHRYKIEVEIVAPQVISDEVRDAESGMVMDFGLIKKVLMETIHDQYDHTLILWEKDELWQTPGFREALEYHTQKVNLIPVIPTAEELARHWGMEFYQAWRTQLHQTHKDIKIAMKKFRVWETPNSFADFG